MQSTEPKVYEGEVLPPAQSYGHMWINGEAEQRQKMFEKECGRAAVEALDTLRFDPFAHEPSLLQVVLDPWASATHIPKPYREEKPNPGNILPAKPAVKKVVHT